eukprot:scaffold305236_cov17-Prasinocladus_malaysianus.AAC.2
MKICTMTAIDFNTMDIVITSANDIDKIDIDDAVDVTISTVALASPNDASGQVDANLNTDNPAPSHKWTHAAY